MRARGIVTVVAGLVAALVPAGAGHADSVPAGLAGTATTTVSGDPSTLAPWQTLTTASFRTDTTRSWRNTWAATATLGGPVPAGHDVTFAWSVGRLHPNGCESLMSFGETDAVPGPDNSISVEYPIQAGELSDDWDCLEAVVAADGTPTHVVRGPLSAWTRPAGVEARPVSRMRVVAGRTTPTLMIVSSHARPTPGSVVTGTGARASMADVAVGYVHGDEARPVVARIKAPEAGRSTLALKARDGSGSDANDSEFDRSWTVVAKKVERYRLQPGRYASRDGNIRFSVDRQRRVNRFKIKGLGCSGDSASPEMSSAWPGSFQLPRRGQAARVEQFSQVYVGLQMMTTGNRKIAGTFAFVPPGCVDNVSFVARRQG